MNLYVFTKITCYYILTYTSFNILSYFKTWSPSFQNHHILHCWTSSSHCNSDGMLCVLQGQTNQQVCTCSYNIAGATNRNHGSRRVHDRVLREDGGRRESTSSWTQQQWMLLDMLVGVQQQRDNKIDSWMQTLLPCRLHRRVASNKHHMPSLPQLSLPFSSSCYVHWPLSHQG